MDGSIQVGPFGGWPVGVVAKVCLSAIIVKII